MFPMTPIATALVLCFCATAVAAPMDNSHDIALRVLFNGKQLSELESSEVVSLAEAAPGKRVLLEILPTPPADGVYKPGNYFGSVNMIFNAVMPDA